MLSASRICGSADEGCRFFLFLLSDTLCFRFAKRADAVYRTVTMTLSTIVFAVVNFETSV